MEDRELFDQDFCPVCESHTLKPDGLMMKCQSCGYSEKAGSGDGGGWMQELRKNSKYWKCKYFEDFPAPISHEYRRLYLMVRQGQVFPLVYQLRDVMELLLKFPILCAAAYENDGEVSAILVRKRLLLGDWKKTADMLCEKRKGVYVYNIPEELREVIIDICDCYSECNVVEERNQFIGHGALGFEEDEEYRRFCEKLLETAAGHLERNSRRYAAISICAGDEVLRGWRKVCADAPDEGFLIRVNGDTRKLPPYMACRGYGVFTFDCYDSQKSKGFWINYVRGGRQEYFPEYDYFATVFSRKLLLDADSSRDMGDSISTAALDEQLRMLNRAAGYSRPEGTIKWLEQYVMDDTEGAVLHLIMERGMGKTALSYGLESGTVKLRGTKVCVFYCNSTQLRGAGSFTAGVQEALMGDLREKVSGSVPQLYDRALATGEQKAKRMAEALDFFRKAHGRYSGTRKLLLVIDGLDEVPYECREAFDYLPDPKDIPDYCYILLTSRNPETESLSAYTKDRLEGIKAVDRHIVSPWDSENMDTMKRYITKRCRTRDGSGAVRALIEDEEGNLVQLSGGRFLNLAVYAKLLDSGIEVSDLPKLENEELFGYYISDIRKAYGEKLFAEALPLLLIIATAYEPLTLGELAYLFGQEGVTLKMLAFLKDFGAMVVAERNSVRGTCIRIASEAYRDYLEKKYPDNLKEMTKTLYELLVHEDVGSYVDVDEKEHIPDGVLYLASVVCDYIETYGGCEIPAVLGKIYGIGTKVEGVEIYRLERAVKCFHGILKNTDRKMEEEEIPIVYLYRAVKLHSLTRYEEALEDHNRAVKMVDRLLESGRLPDENDAARAHINRAVTLESLKRYEEALEDHNRAVEVLDRLLGSGRLPDEKDVAIAHMNRAVTLESLKRYKEALEDHNRAVEILDRLLESGGLSDEPDTARAHMNRANTLNSLKRYEEALEDHNRTVEIVDQLLESGRLPDETDAVRAHMNRAITLEALPRYEEALEDHNRAVEIVDQLLESGRLPDENDAVRAHRNRAYILESLKQYKKALGDRTRTVEILERLLESGRLPDETDAAIAHMKRAITLDSLKQYEEALEDDNRAVEILDRLLESGRLPDETDAATAHMNRALTLESLKRYEEALEDHNRAVEILDRLLESGLLPDESNAARAHNNRALTLIMLERYDEAREDYNQATTIVERLPNS